jgi:transposase
MVLAQHFSQILSPGAPLSFEKSRLGALAQGYSSDLWTLARVGRLIETLTGQRYCESGVWRLLKRLGFSKPAADRACYAAR